jgi:hypothetical protein
MALQIAVQVACNDLTGGMDFDAAMQGGMFDYGRRMLFRLDRSFESALKSTRLLPMLDLYPPRCCQDCNETRRYTGNRAEMRLPGTEHFPQAGSPFAPCAFATLARAALPNH